MFGQVIPKLQIELYQAEHGHRNTCRFEDLHPDMRESRTEAVGAVDVGDLRQHRDDREKNADETVLEDTDPDDLPDVSKLSLTLPCIY